MISSRERTRRKQIFARQRQARLLRPLQLARETMPLASFNLVVPRNGSNIHEAQLAEVLTAPNSVTVATSTAFARELGDALARNDDLALDLDALGDVDLSFVQIVHAARDLAMRTGKAVRLVRPAPAVVHALLKRAGFLDPPAPGDLTFWFDGATSQ